MKNKKGLFDNKRFKWLEQERFERLKGLSIEKSVKMMEGLISFANELRRNFLPDNPCSLKIGLKNKNQQ